jgi:phage shock protein A
LPTRTELAATVDKLKAQLEALKQEVSDLKAEASKPKAPEKVEEPESTTAKGKRKY